VRETLEPMRNLSVKYLPPYSCGLNPIEKLWHVAKAKWRKKLIVEGRDEISQPAKIVAMIESCVDAVPLATVRNIMQSCNQAMIQSLNGRLV
jgi:hypothetical protein